MMLLGIYDSRKLMSDQFMGKIQLRIRPQTAHTPTGSSFSHLVSFSTSNFLAMEFARSCLNGSNRMTI